MGRRAKLYEMVCVDCGLRDSMDRQRADRSGWDLWLGAGRCPQCVEKKDAATPAPLPSNYPQVPSGPPREVFVQCAGCGKTFESLEYEDGHRPTIHWLTTEENKRKLREDKIPIPLCPGLKLAGVVVTGEGR